MINIKRYALFLKIILILGCIPTFVHGFFKTTINWINGLVPKNVAAGLEIFYQSITPTVKALCIFIDVVIPSIILIFGFIYFVKILNLFKKGEIFSKPVFLCFKRLARVAFIWVIYSPISFILLGLIVTMNNPKGSRYLAIGFNTQDILNIIVFGFFSIITSIMYEGLVLKKQSDLTV
ncbi:DUF2975 domain-containing protein [Candidatus Dependentiae bacterium]|nr:DUF2975 domain-containing protein [Candidatus Dependentiae bacterium]MBU4387210.1 DUF2975 domain-containing protein [Candidatus Dependentiae bacterium]MCG2756372.1 DUF2975 domain-containing protein [Candidatus Dependentiae bacterium]